MRRSGSRRRLTFFGCSELIYLWNNSVRFDIDNLRTMRPPCGGIHAMKMDVVQSETDGFRGERWNGGSSRGRRRDGPILAGAALGSGNGHQWVNPFAASRLRLTDKRLKSDRTTTLWIPSLTISIRPCP
jgi:hypothetical protein